MTDAYGRPTFADGLNIMNSALSIKKFRDDQADRALQLENDKEDQALKKKAQDENAAKDWTAETTSRGILEKGADYQPDEATKKDPRFRAQQYMESTQTGLSSLMKSDEFKAVQQENELKRSKALKETLTNKFGTAWAAYQTNPQQGFYQLLDLYDDIPDGLDIVRGSDGLPVINQKTNTMKMKNRKGTVAEVPVPTADDIYKMASTALLEGGIEKASPEWMKSIKAYNFGQMMNGTFYKNENGRMVVKYDSLIDPNDSKKTVTKVIDIDTKQELTPQQFGRGGFKEVSMKDDADSASTNSQVNALQKELNIALMPFGKGTGQLTDYTGNVTREAQSAFQVALSTLQKYQGNPEAAKTIQGKAEYAAAQKAVALWQQLVGDGAAGVTAQEPPTGAAGEAQQAAEAQRAIAMQKAEGQQQAQAPQNTQQQAQGLPDGLDEQTIQFNMQKYGKSREEVIAKYQQLSGK